MSATPLAATADDAGTAGATRDESQAVPTSGTMFSSLLHSLVFTMPAGAMYTAVLPMLSAM